MEQNIIPDKLFHYCSLQSFTGIVFSKTLHFCSAKYSNDPNESKISLAILRKIHESLEDTLKKPFLDDVVSQMKDTNWGFFNTPYVFCMSEREDDLNQWRIYSDNGRGVMLQMKTDFFKTNRIGPVLGKEFVKGPKLEALYLDQCIYDPLIQYEIIESIITSFTAFYWNENIGKMNTIGAFFNFFNFFSAFFKDESYKEEKEWRLVCFPIEQQAFNTVNYKINYKVKRSVIVPFIEIANNSSFENVLFIKALIGSNTTNSPHEIMNFVQNNAFHISTIGKSKVKIQEID